MARVREDLAAVRSPPWMRRALKAVGVLARSSTWAPDLAWSMVRELRSCEEARMRLAGPVSPVIAMERGAEAGLAASAGAPGLEVVWTRPLEMVRDEPFWCVWGPARITLPPPLTS